MNKKQIIISLIGVVASCSLSVAENYLQVVPATLAAGSTATLTLQISGSEPWSAFQMELELPAALTVGTPTVGDKATTGHSFELATATASHTGYNAYRLVGYATDNAQFTANEGVVLNLPITANSLTEGVYTVYANRLILDNGTADDLGAEVLTQSSYLTVGAPVAKNIELQGAVPTFVASAINAEPNALVFADAAIAGVDHNVVVNGTCSNFVLGPSYTNETAFSATTASYSRNVNASTEWGTLCIPFAVRSTSDVQLYQLSGSQVNGSEATYLFSPVTSAEAGQPVVFKKLNESATSVVFTAASTDVAAASTLQPSAPVTGWTMPGTYVPQELTVTEGDLSSQSVYYFSADVFYLATGQLTVPAYRSWFQTAKAQGAPVRFLIGEGEAQGIQYIEQEDGRVQVRYDLMGRQTHGTHGLQIMGGQKVMNR